MQGGWCLWGDPTVYWEFAGPFWCHHQDCRDAEAEMMATPAAPVTERDQ